MIKASTVEIQGEKHFLLYDMNALFEVQEKYGKNAFDTIDGDDRESLAAAVGIFTILSEEGARIRRLMGYETGNTPKVDIEILTPMDWLRMKVAITAAVSAAMESEFENNEDVDLILLEYQKKTENR